MNCVNFCQYTSRMPKKRRRSARLLAKCTQRKKKKKRSKNSGASIPSLPNEVLEHIIKFVPHHQRDTFAGVNKHWSGRAWKVPIHKHVKTLASTCPNDDFTLACTCDACHHSGQRRCVHEVPICPCPKCITELDVFDKYLSAKQIISEYSRGASNRKEFMEDLENVMAMTNRSCLFRFKQMCGILCEVHPAFGMPKFCVSRD